jgi:hypothetical protein
LPAALYGVLVWPFIWGLTEQMTYNGYLVPRFQVLCRSTSLAIVFVAFAWSLQHAFMPLTFDAKFMAFRLLSSVPNTVFQTLLYLRLRRVGSARDCARPDGWCECANRRASSVGEGMMRPLPRRVWRRAEGCLNALPNPYEASSCQETNIP